MNQKCRIGIQDSLMDVMMKLSEGNPGAITVIASLSGSAEKVDPDALLGPFAPLLSLDSHSIYGPDIWVLFKNVCDQNIVKTHAVLRGIQLGLVAEKDVKDAIKKGHMYQSTLDTQAILNKVQERLPKFGKVEPNEQQH